MPVANGTSSLSPIADDKTQLITVVTEEWRGFRGTLRRYERTRGADWIEVAAPIAVVIGREGYGWGRGLHGNRAPSDASGPLKREGDGKSPAGAFGLREAYGYEARIEGVSLPYVHATRQLRCVDDPASRHYNRIVDSETTARDWNSAEHMRRDDALYAITIVVEHNTDDPAPGGGSCIFLHVWIDEETGMSGCTAMPLEDVRQIAAWLEPNAAVLVALPREAYEALRADWQLPD